MIRIVRGSVGPAGLCDWWVAGHSVEGRSHQPLLDACRALKRMGEPAAAEVGLFREGRSGWDLRTTIGYGASLSVREDNSRPLVFEKYKPFKGIA